MMKPCNDKRCVYKTEDCPEYHFKGTCDSCIYYAGNGRTDFPADGSQYKMSSHYCQNKTAERNHNHGDYLRCYAPEKLFQIDQTERRHDRRKHLCLVTDHIYLYKSEIPNRNV